MNHQQQRRWIGSSIDSLHHRMDRLWPEDEGNGHGHTHWKGKPIIPTHEWVKLSGNGAADTNRYNVREAIQFFPEGYIRYIFPLGLAEIPTKNYDYDLEFDLKRWYSDYLELMEYTKNREYGKTKCFSCLLSPDREEAAIFIGINKVISRSLDIDTDVESTSTSTGTNTAPTSTTTNLAVYPCPVLDRFRCPYDDTITVNRDNIHHANHVNVEHLHYLSELAFAVELAMAKALETHKIRNAQDAYNVLTDKRTLEMVLDEGLKEEHRQYKDSIIQLFTNMQSRNRIKMSDLKVYPS